MSDSEFLFDITELVTPTYEPEQTIQQRFDAWVALNPWVIPAVEHLVRAWLAAGHKRVGIKQVWEVLRWQYGTTVGDTFKANNTWTSRVARLLIERNPEWADVIETRELRAA